MPIPYGYGGYGAYPTTAGYTPQVFVNQQTYGATATAATWITVPVTTAATAATVNYDQLTRGQLIRDYRGVYSGGMVSGYYPSSFQNTGTVYTGMTGTQWADASVLPPPTPEQQSERRRQAELDDRAAARAKALLLEHLSEQQRAEYEEKRYFHVIGQSGKVYRIRHGAIGNIYEIGLDGSELHKYCVHFTDALPNEDHMLGQMLRLKYDEEALLTTANRHW